MKIRANQVKKVFKRGPPKKPKTDDPKQDPQSKAKHKTRLLGGGGARPTSGHYGLTLVDTMSHGVRHSQLVLAATAIVAVFSPGASVSFTAFRFPMRYFDFCCCFVFKKRMNMAGKEGRFHSLATLKLPQTPLKEKEKKKKQRHRV